MKENEVNVITFEICSNKDKNICKIVIYVIFISKKYCQ